MYIHKLLFIINSDFLFSDFLFSNLLITPILYFIFSILTLLTHQVLLAGLLRIIGNINGYSIVLNSTQLFSISAEIKDCINNIIVKNIKGMLPLRPRLIKLQVSNRKLSKDRKTYFNITAIFTTHTLIIRTEGIRSYIVSLIVCLQDLFIGFLVLRECVGKII